MQGTYDLSLQYKTTPLTTTDKQPTSVSTRNLRLGSRLPNVAYQRDPATSSDINSNPGKFEIGHLADASLVEQNQNPTSRKDNLVTLGSSLNYSLLEGGGQVKGLLSTEALQSAAMPGDVRRPRLVTDVGSTQAGVARASFHGATPSHMESLLAFLSDC
jgi:hypothetical protein